MVEDVDAVGVAGVAGALEVSDGEEAAPVVAGAFEEAAESVL